MLIQLIACCLHLAYVNVMLKVLQLLLQGSDNHKFFAGRHNAAVYSKISLFPIATD